jgi:hypothetical protein
VRPLRSLVLYLLAVLLLGALCAPGLHGLAVWGRHHIPFLAPLAEDPFHRVVRRSLLLVAVLGLWPLLRGLNIRSWDGVGLVRPAGQWPSLAWGFAAGFGSLAAVALLAIATGARSLAVDSHWAASLLTAALSAGVVAVVEEVLFRGALFGALRQAHHWLVALAVSSGVYALVHFFQRAPSSGSVTWSSGFVTLGQMFRGFVEFEVLVPGFFTLILAGLILGLAYHRTGNLYFSIGLHAGWIFWLKSYAVLTDAQPEGPTRLWGSARLIDGWPAFAILGVLLGVMAAFLRGPQGTRLDRTS